MPEEQSVSAPEINTPPPVETNIPEPDLGAAERMQRQIEQRQTEIFESVKTGEDVEGGLLYSNYKDTAEKGSAGLGSMSSTLERTRRLAEGIDEPGNSNKLLDNLSVLYQEAGLGQYEVGPDEDGNELSVDAAKQKMVEDVNAFPEKYADARIQKYCEQAAKVSLAREKVKELSQKEGATRGEVRRAAYELQRQEDRLLLGVLQPEMRSLYDPEDQDFRKEQIYKLNDIVDSVRERRSFEPEELSEEQLEPDTDDLRRVDEDLVQRITESRDERHADAFARADTEKKVDVLGNLDQLQKQEEMLKGNLARAIEAGDAEAITHVNGELREVRLQEKSLNMRAEVIAVEQLAADSIDNLRGSAAKFGDEIVAKGISGSSEQANEMVNAAFEVASAHFNVASEKVKKELSEMYEARVAGKVEGVVDKLKGIKEWAARNSIDRLRDLRNTAKEKLNDIREKLKAVKDKVATKFESDRIDRMRQHYDKRHETEKKWFMMGYEIGRNAKGLRDQLKIQARRAELVIARTLGADEQAVTEEQQVLQRKQTELGEQREADIEGKRTELAESENPHYKKFDDRLRERLGSISEGESPGVVEEGEEESRDIESEIEVGPTENVAGPITEADESGEEQTALNEVREGATDYELVHAASKEDSERQYDNYMFFYLVDGQLRLELVGPEDLSSSTDGRYIEVADEIDSEDMEKAVGDYLDRDVFEDADVQRDLRVYRREDGEGFTAVEQLAEQEDSPEQSADAGEEGEGEPEVVQGEEDGEVGEQEQDEEESDTSESEGGDVIEDDEDEAGDPETDTSIFDKDTVTTDEFNKYRQTNGDNTMTLGVPAINSLVDYYRYIPYPDGDGGAVYVHDGNALESTMQKIGVAQNATEFENLAREAARRKAEEYQQQQ